MSNFVQSLPLDIPWKIVSSSPDMMDAQICDQRLPHSWRSSLALSAFEPKAADLPDELCGQRVSFIKMTATITGFQPSPDEVMSARLEFPTVPTSVLNDALGEYWGCYGALLHVSVAPLVLGLPADEVVEAGVDFAKWKVADTYPAPLEVQGFRFLAVSGGPARFGQHRIVDVKPSISSPWADAWRGALDLGTKTVIVLPFSATEIDVVVVQAAGEVVVTGLTASDLLVDSVQGVQYGGDQTLSLRGSDIATVVVEAQSNEAYLLAIRIKSERRPNIPLRDYPHIVDFEPKMRDLYQAASETGEILTASVSKATTGKSLTHTDSTETGLSLGAEVGLGNETAAAKAKLSAGLSHKWGSTDTDVRSLTSESSRERREIEGTTTNLSQLYNLLTGYHAGTNRAVFLMLPRPHTLQPTDRRTFVQGLRMIEGVQEFMLVVIRPPEQDGLCIEARLDTGHFPEHVETEQPLVEYDKQDMVFHVSAYTNSGEIKIESSVSATFTLPSGWVVDHTKGDVGHPAISQGSDRSNRQARLSLRAHNYQATSDSTVQVSGRIKDAPWWGSGAIFERDYTVHMRSQAPKKPPQDAVVTTPFFSTRRSLCACFKSGETCVEPVEDENPTPSSGPIVYEGEVRVPAVLLEPLEARSIDASRAAVTVSRTLLQAVRTCLTSAVATQGAGDVASPGSFLRTDAFRDRLLRRLKAADPETTATMLTEPGSAVIRSDDFERELASMAVGDIVSMSAGELSGRLGVTATRAAGIRTHVLRSAIETRDKRSAVRADQKGREK